MKETIIAKLLEIEKKEKVKIIYAIESGSRAWGFKSPDSDYDVRFIYLRSPEFYLRLDKTRDVIEWQLDEVLDINGWDLQKALSLLHTSNLTFFEWSNSSIIYKTTVIWSGIKQNINDYFQVKHGSYHYLNSAKQNYDKYATEKTILLKKYFYILRPLLACKWILDKKSPPPMLFSELIESELEEEMLVIIKRLLAEKIVTSEQGKRERIVKLDEYIEQSLIELEAETNDLPKDDKPDWQGLNKLFIQSLKEACQ